MSISRQKGQAMLEYAILIAVVIAALIIMQMIVKRGYQGNLKDSSGKMGDQYSVENSALNSKRTMGTDQIITEEQATTAAMSSDYLPGGYDSSVPVMGVLSKNAAMPVLAFTERQGGAQKIAIDQVTDSANKEAVRIGDYVSTTAVDDYTLNKEPD